MAQPYARRRTFAPRADVTSDLSLEKSELNKIRFGQTRSHLTARLHAHTCAQLRVLHQPPHDLSGGCVVARRV